MKHTRNIKIDTSTNILGFLGVLFVGLKLTKFINWSWWIVLLPFYAGLILLIAILLTLFLYELLSSFLNKNK